MLEAALYLIPVTLGDTPHDRVLPAYNREVTSGIRHFVVENVRSARRFLKRCDPATDIDAITFYTLDRHTPPEAVAGFLAPLAQGLPVGVISEAGCPAVADPGADVVAVAQRKGYKVVPLVGPSSILLSLMASGFNGQSFAFHGYLPIDSGERAKAMKRLEQRIYNENETQIFIETPYFMPTEQVLMALQTAALSGIDVRLIVPQHSDSMMTQLATRSYLKDLLKSGVKVYMYKAGFIHSKMMVSDDLLTVIGSCNMDFRSFLQNFEANAFIYDKDFAAIAKRQFQADQAQSVRVTHQVWKHRKWHIKVKESIVRIFSPLL